MITAITVILVISFLVFVHELGHFLAARAVGVRVLEFSIGFPPKVVSKVIGQTEYMLSLIPIGGYVRLYGQNIDDENPDEADNYASKTPGQRFLILVAGPLMNLVVAFTFMPFVYFIGYDIPAYLMKPPVISAVTDGSDADKIDIRGGDQIRAINETPVKTWREVQNALEQAEDARISLSIQRDQETITRIFNSNRLSQKGGFGWQIAADPVVGKVSSDSAAEESGLMPDDRIVAIDRNPVHQWSDISPMVQQSNGEEISITIERNNRQLQKRLTPRWNSDREYWIIGIAAPTVRVSEPIGQAFRSGVKQVVSLFVRTMTFLYQLIALQADTDTVGGPIMIAQMVGKAAKTDLSSLISLVAFISLQFAIFNLLPIPALDGGHIFFLGLEKLKGDALSKKFRISVQKIGFTLLLFLIIYISIQDSLRIFSP